MIQGAAIKSIIAMAMALGLVACREEEQGRPLYHEPGVYKGQQDTKLDEQKRDKLRQRTLLQR